MHCERPKELFGSFYAHIVGRCYVVPGYRIVFRGAPCQKLKLSQNRKGGPRPCFPLPIWFGAGARARWRRTVRPVLT
jgi:hypothetical protein